MPKVITGGMQTKLNQALGSEPLMLIKIEWGGSIGTKYYSEKDIALFSSSGRIDSSGRIKSIGNLKISRYQDNFGSIGSFDLSLDDYDKHFLNIMNTVAIENRTVTLYHYYANLSASDLLPLFVGKIVAPINWSEGEHYLTFGVFSNYNDGDVGMVVPDPDIDPLKKPNGVTILDEDSIGSFIPIVFGNVMYSPCLRVATGKTSSTVEEIHFNDALYNEALGEYTNKTVLVEKGHEFPQFTELSVYIDNVLFNGIFGPAGSSNFFINDHNVILDLANAPVYRDVNDGDYYNLQVCWIDTNVNLVNKWVLFYDVGRGFVSHFCVKQEGDKCTFSEFFAAENPNYNNAIQPIKINGKIVDANPGPFLYLFNGARATQAAGKFSYKWAARYGNNYYENWTIPRGAGFSVVATDVWIANYIPNSVIAGVYAYRDIKNWIYDPIKNEYKESHSERKLCQVPLSYYGVNGQYPFNGKLMTAVLLDRKLSQRDGEYWEDQLYVIQASPVGDNTTDEIKWIVETFTDLTCDPVSFASVHTLLENIPSNFGLFNQSKAIEICQKIAWQARCTMTILNNIVYIKFLAKQPVAFDAELDLDKIQYKSVNLTFSDTEDILTKITGEYRFNLAIARKEKVIFKNNIEQYGLKEETWDFFIYNNRNYVQQAIKFWGKYYSESWKKVKLTGFLNSLKLDLFDYPELQFGSTYPFGMSEVPGIVENWDYSSDTFLINMIFWTPVKAGTLAIDTTFWQDDSNLQYFNPVNGTTVTDYSVPLRPTPPIIYEGDYGVVQNVQDEVVGGNTTGRKIYDVTVYPFGFENTIPINVIKARKLIPDPDNEIPIVSGDKVTVNTYLKRTYIQPLANAGTSPTTLVGVVRNDSSQGNVSTFLVDIYDDFDVLVAETPTFTNQVAIQTGSPYYFFRGEVVAIVKINNVLNIQKLNLSDIKEDVPNGLLSVQALGNAQFSTGGAIFSLLRQDVAIPWEDHFDLLNNQVSVVFGVKYPSAIVMMLLTKDCIIPFIQESGAYGTIINGSITRLGTTISEVRPGNYATDVFVSTTLSMSINSSTNITCPSGTCNINTSGSGSHDLTLEASSPSYSAFTAKLPISISVSGSGCGQIGLSQGPNTGAVAYSLVCANKDNVAIENFPSTKTNLKMLLCENVSGQPILTGPINYTFNFSGPIVPSTSVCSGSGSSNISVTSSSLKT